jgi:hypothetical protein
MADHLPPVFVRRIGDQYPRYLLQDSTDLFWAGDLCWTNHPSCAVLFYSEVDAIEARNRLALGGDAGDTFAATILVTTHVGEWTAEELISYMRKHRKSFLRGPRGKRGILLEIVPDVLKKVEPFEEEQNGLD